MMIAYKLTNQDLITHGNFQWILGEWVETSGEGPLCSPGWLHFYTHPLLAVLLNPLHARIQDPRLWEAEVGGETISDHGLKVGYTRARLVRELPLPDVTLIQRVEFGIRCALTVSQSDKFTRWAEAWLSGKDRSYVSARTILRSFGRYNENLLLDRYSICNSSHPWNAAYAARAASYAADTVINYDAIPEIEALIVEGVENVIAASSAPINLIHLAKLSCGVS